MLQFQKLSHLPVSMRTNPPASSSERGRDRLGRRGKKRAGQAGGEEGVGRRRVRKGTRVGKGGRNGWERGEEQHAEKHPPTEKSSR